jgi:hypothetical protein
MSPWPRILCLGEEIPADYWPRALRFEIGAAWLQIGSYPSPRRGAFLPGDRFEMLVTDDGVH